MRYAAHLRTSKRQNILQSHLKSGLVALLFFVSAGAVAVWLAGAAHLSLDQFFVGFLYSLTRTTIAYVFALVIALALALLTTSSRWVENLMLPILDVMQSFPSFALFPVLLVAL